MLHSKFIVIVTLFGLAASIIVLDPMNPTLRWGQVIKMRCKARWSIDRCLWKVIDKWQQYNHTFGNLQDGECGFDLETKLIKIPGTKKIEISCTVFSSKNRNKSVTNATSVTIVVPKTRVKSEFPIDNGKISVMADKESMLTCTVAGARPQPRVLWKIGNPKRNQFVY